MGDKAPKRVKSIKKAPKAEVRAQTVGRREGVVAPVSALSVFLTPTATGFQDAEDPAQEEDLRRG